MTATPAKVRQILERVSDALSQTEVDVRVYMKEHSEFKDVGTRMSQEWQTGGQVSLRAG
jgi:serine/threonine-protein kinase HipA